MSERVIVIGPSPPPVHGSSVMTERLVESLGEHGLLAAHLDTRDPRPLSTIGRLDATNVTLAVRHAAQLIGLLVRHPRARVYVPISQARLGFLRDAVFLLVARAARRPRIVHLHGGYFAAFYQAAGPTMRAVIRLSLAGVEQAWVLTEGLRPMFEGLVPADRVRVIANAVDDSVGASASAEPEAPKGVLRVLYLANLLPEKGCFDLVAALERASLKTPVDLRLVGSGAPEVEVALEQRSEQLQDRGVSLSLPGPAAGAAKDREYRDADIYVFPTRYPFEGQPLVLLEAMAAGLPIITTTIGGIPDTVEHEADGILVPPGDIEALTEAVAALAGDPERRRRLGSAARASYQRRYTSSRFDHDVETALRGSGPGPREAGLTSKPR